MGGLDVETIRIKEHLEDEITADSSFFNDFY
jgi:hypothetical protein